ncbi:RHS repeat-associated core domain-containing protein [Pseudomonas sp. P97.38]|uniref:RHS repeat-associated core domain-containing protein n=1 Tax=Pseudomonas sp. P97.38 TaxID=255451 RepID=UPI000A662FEA|nr:RHS repeat-associated core domain-containing protein [Pseudomonas sp. P97.38]
MLADPRETVLCRYYYDPLDRLTACAPTAEAGIQRFYCKSRLATEIKDAVQYSVFQHDDQLLAQVQRENAKTDATLLATDQQRSVLNALDAARPHPFAYTPYGHRPAEHGLLSLLGFNGERPDPVTGHYLLGNGYRAFNPVLMRFNSPDSWSPFGEGGVNAYAYCVGDPRNAVDPTGHVKFIYSIKDAVRAFNKERANLATTISRTGPISGDRGAAIASKTSKRGNLAARASNRVHSSDLKDLADTIVRNEQELSNDVKTYSISTPLKTYEEAVLAREEARKAYNYNRTPTVYKPHYVQYPENGSFINSPVLLDPLHFDAEIYFQKFKFKKQQAKYQTGNRDAIHSAIIRRAIYIRKFTSHDLMTIRR